MLSQSFSVDMFLPRPNFDDLESLNDELIQTSDLKLPHIIKDHVPRITRDQLANMLQDPLSVPFDQIIILDGRYPYEYNGGHIRSAKNIISRAQLRRIFRNCSNKNYCLICHCEYSQQRGPALFQMIRSYDRECNHYPKLSIPEMYVLDGGYRLFYEKYQSLCVGGYTEMRDDFFVNSGELRRCHSIYKRQMERPRSSCYSSSPISFMNSSTLSQDDEVQPKLKRSMSEKRLFSQNISFSVNDPDFSSSLFPLSSSQPGPTI